jgi:hypothetical protein
MKICPVEAELFHADRQTDMMKLIVAFRNFTKAPKNITVSTSLSIRLPYNAFYPFTIYISYFPSNLCSFFQTWLRLPQITYIIIPP